MLRVNRIKVCEKSVTKHFSHQWNITHRKSYHISLIIFLSMQCIQLFVIYQLLLRLDIDQFSHILSLAQHLLYDYLDASESILKHMGSLFTYSMQHYMNIVFFFSFWILGMWNVKMLVWYVETKTKHKIIEWIIHLILLCFVMLSTCDVQWDTLQLVIWWVSNSMMITGFQESHMIPNQYHTKQCFRWQAPLCEYSAMHH